MFSLNDHIREAMEEHPGAGPDELLPVVLNAIQPKDRKEALRQCLREPIRHVLSERARTAISDLAVPLTKSGRPRKLTAAGRVPGVGTNPLAGIGRFEAVLAQPIQVRGKWVPVGDLTASDLAWLADERLKHAAENTARAEQFTKLKLLVTQEGVERVRDLSESLLAELL